MSRVRRKTSTSSAFTPVHLSAHMRDSSHLFTRTIVRGLALPLRMAVEDRTPCRIEHRIIIPDGFLRWVACRGQVMLGESEPVTGMTATIEEITARKELELVQQDLRDTLEPQVRECTAGLEHTVTDLKTEVERRKLAESALQASEQRYQSLYERTPSCISPSRPTAPCCP